SSGSSRAAESTRRACSTSPSAASTTAKTSPPSSARRASSGKKRTWSASTPGCEPRFGAEGHRDERPRRTTRRPLGESGPQPSAVQRVARILLRGDPVAPQVRPHVRTLHPSPPRHLGDVSLRVIGQGSEIVALEAREHVALRLLELLPLEAPGRSAGE